MASQPASFEILEEKEIDYSWAERKGVDKWLHSNLVFGLAMGLMIALTLAGYSFLRSNTSEEVLRKGESGDTGAGAPETRLEEPTGEPGQVQVIPVEDVITGPAFHVSVRETFRNYHQAESITEKARQVRVPLRVLTSMRAYYSREGMRDPEGEYELSPISALRVGDRQFVNFRYQAGGGAAIPLSMEKTGDGRILIDWESFVGLGKMNWASFLRARPETPTLMRVLASDSDRYGFEFAEGEDWNCMKLQRPGEDEVCYGYFKEDSEVDKKLAGPQLSFSSGGESLVPLTVLVQFPEGGGAGADKGLLQVEILEVRGTGWLVP